MNNFEHRVLRIDSTVVQMCASQSTEFTSQKKVEGENRGEMGSSFVIQVSTHTLNNPVVDDIV